jgi:xanthine dehydrogenase accessory factor
LSGRIAVVRGGGDLATGIIYRLWKSKFRVLCLEIGLPLAVRRPVSVAEAVFEGQHTVEGMTAVLIKSLDEWKDDGGVAVLVDPEGASIGAIKPDVVVDAVMSKRYTGTHRAMAPLVMAIGPGFSAPNQVHAVVETKRGHYLGRLITNGSAAPNTGVPGMEMGYTVERLLRAAADGHVTPIRQIGDHVEAGDIVAQIGGEEVRAAIKGVLRGLLHPKVNADKGLKIGDIDPRDEPAFCFSITDKALAIAGGVLEGIMSLSDSDTGSK